MVSVVGPGASATADMPRPSGPWRLACLEACPRDMHVTRAIGGVKKALRLRETWGQGLRVHFNGVPANQIFPVHGSRGGHL